MRRDFFYSIGSNEKVNEGVTEEAARSESTEIFRAILDYRTYGWPTLSIKD